MKHFLTICICLLALGLSGQENDISRVLREIEQNNEELGALQLKQESQQLSLKSSNNLPDPQVGAYYLPFGKHDDAGDYFEFEVSQSIAFPSVYKAREQVIGARQQQLAIAYAVKRQDVLHEAQVQCLELIYLNKLHGVEELRMQQAHTLFAQVEHLFESGQAGVLELNKAKVAWLQKQFAVSQIQNRIDNVLLILTRMNGGAPIALNQADFTGPLDLPPRDSIWQDMLTMDPAVQALHQQEQVALTEYRLSQKQDLPDLSAGLSYQGMSGFYHAGVFAGLSIPLWSNRHKEKAAQQHHVYVQALRAAQTRTMRSDFEKKMNAYQLLLEKYRAYRQTLSGLNSDALLLQAYELGEIAFITYYNELQFYRQAYDSMLEMEVTLNQQRSEILKHQL